MTQNNRLEHAVWCYNYGHEVDKDELIEMLLEDRGNNSDVEEKISDLESEIDELESTVNDLEKDLSDMEAERDSLEATVDYMRDENQDLMERQQEDMWEF